MNVENVPHLGFPDEIILTNHVVVVDADLDHVVHRQHTFEVERRAEVRVQLFRYVVRSVLDQLFPNLWNGKQMDLTLN